VTQSSRRQWLSKRPLWTSRKARSNATCEAGHSASDVNALRRIVDAARVRVRSLNNEDQVSAQITRAGGRAQVREQTKPGRGVRADSGLQLRYMESQCRHLLAVTTSSANIMGKSKQSIANFLKKQDALISTI
jgi:hypothetical protein